MCNEVNVNRNHKDRVFRMLFKEKAACLSLYNALNGTDYSDVSDEDFQIRTLENAIYMGMKNDVAFMLFDQLMLYEHQSTVNPNIPLRNLFYVSEVYSGMVDSNRMYSSSLVKIPEPTFVEFYNGRTKVPERYEKKLSDAFITNHGDPELELKVSVININSGNNEELKQACETLYGYCYYVEKVREYMKTEDIQKAVPKAVDDCIKNDILSDFFKKNRDEVTKVSILYEFNQEEYDAFRKREVEQALLKIEQERAAKEKAVAAKEQAMQEKEIAESKALELKAEVERLRALLSNK